MATRTRLDVLSSPDGIAHAMDELARIMPPELAQEERHCLLIALGEALGNIARHGYKGTEGRVFIEASRRPEALLVVIVDWGTAVPEVKWRDTDVHMFDFDPTSIDELPESGMGLALIRIAFDDVRYESNGGANRLMLRKEIGAPQAHATA